ncbi:Hypothetical protein ADU72_0141 (plasmid) [Pediococcus damnosus]|uniref:HEPN domain-containing protein n=1 Tax=Pediococcus damnosus TaxID=51663 RepID=A0AAC9B3J1_9LACO|nr:hypothetical protein [Pediococcus damnosus]AMV63741.1 Hypothetical protein ADU70_0217 [Pediococcus damnosus]AMV68330.1 Hypothetical protein ADU72_0141 [Pediococcus damnosus]
MHLHKIFYALNDLDAAAKFAKNLIKGETWGTVLFFQAIAE